GRDNIGNDRQPFSEAQQVRRFQVQEQQRWNQQHQRSYGAEHRQLGGVHQLGRNVRSSQRIAQRFEADSLARKGETERRRGHQRQEEQDQSHADDRSAHSISSCNLRAGLHTSGDQREFFYRSHLLAFLSTKLRKPMAATTTTT